MSYQGLSSVSLVLTECLRCSVEIPSQSGAESLFNFYIARDLLISYMAFSKTTYRLLS